MPTETLHYPADGLDMIGRLVLPEGISDPRPGVLVFPHGFGPGAHSLGIAERLASELGYVALECDLHGGARTVAFEDVQDALRPMTESADHVRARTSAAHAALAARPEVDTTRIAALGYCFGGTMAFELALAGADLRTAIGLHPTLRVTSPEDAASIRCSVMAIFGDDDPAAPTEERAAFTKMLRDAKVDYTLTIYGGVVHAFTVKGVDRLGITEMARYDARADRRAWLQMTDMLAEALC